VREDSMRRFVLVFLVTGVSMSLFAASAGADPPDRHQLDFTDRFSTTGICGFRTTFTWVGTGYGTIFTDRDGDLVRQTDRIRERLTVTSGGGSHWVSGKDAYSITVRADGTFTRTGLWFHLKGPNGSVVLRDVGRLVVQDDEIVLMAGQHDWLNGDFDDMCAALSG
jgi:hypothetical protein